MLGSLRQAARESEYKWELTSGLECLARVLTTQGEPARAARLWGVAEVLREAMGAPLPPIERESYEQAIAAARALIGKEAFAEGSTMTPEQALAARTTRASTAIPAPTLAEQVSAPQATLPAIYPDGLTVLEVKVLNLIAQRLTNKQVAEKLYINSRTLNDHLTSISSKIGVSTRSAAIRYVIDRKLV